MTPKRTIFEVFLDNKCYVVGTVDSEMATHLDRYLPSLSPYSGQVAKLFNSCNEDVEPITVNLTRNDIRQLAYYYCSDVVGINDAEQVYFCLNLLYDQGDKFGDLTVTFRNVFDDEEEAK